VLMENGIWEFADQKITPPTDATQLADHNKKDVKDERRIILDAVKDHVIPHLSRKRQPRICGRL